jgi:hypothetical protein
MKRLTRLWSALAIELGEQLSVHVARDIETVTSRVEREGFSFLAITLPAFAGDFESSLESGEIDPTHFRAFRKDGRAPAFLQGFLGRVFDTKSGTLLSTPDVQCIWAIRQLTLFYKKTEIECSEPRINAAIRRYVECDAEVSASEVRILNSSLFSELQRVFSSLFWRPLRSLDKAVSEYRLSPTHGPGATADRLLGNRKWIQVEWPERFERENIFPFREYVLPRYGLFEIEPQYIPKEFERPVKVVHVPKTLSSPRIIAEEPTCMMYMQKGIANALVPALERDQLVGPMIGFTDQVPNQDLARKGSIDGLLATLDLKEASDRVPYNVIGRLIRPIAPHLWDAMDACRSTHADVQGQTLKLNKFASMGSALCFPVEAMFFLSIVFVGIRRSLGCSHLTDDQLRSMQGKVRVYGDDIIVPTDVARSVRESLLDFGLVVNEGKSFSHGNFRESCGGEFYQGEKITPVRARRRFPSSRRDVSEVVSWTDTMNQLYFSGLWKTSETVRVELEALLGPLPVIPPTSEGLGLHSFMPSNSGTRMSPNHQLPQVKTWVTRSRKPSLSVDGYYALRKCFAGDFYESRNAGHLDTSGRPSVVQLIRRWVDVDDLRV